MSPKKVLLYGATGFTANLMIEPLKKLPCELILAGRTRSAVTELAKQHRLPYRIFSLERPKKVQQGLDTMDLVLNCAGPFAKTARPIVDAALRTSTSYFDISGEIDVFTDLYTSDAQAKRQNIAIIPGVGFDIAPSDCLAKLLSERLPNPINLSLAIVAKNTRASHGTLKTALSAIQNQFIARRCQGIRTYRDLAATKELALLGKTYAFIRAPLPDLFCAHLSTGAVNIDTYLAIPRRLLLLARCLPVLGRIVRRPIVKKMLGQLVAWLPNGPSAEQQSKGYALIYGEVTDASGHCESALIKTPEPYAYTAYLIVAATKKWLLKGLPTGFLTPSQAFGSHFACDTGSELMGK